MEIEQKILDGTLTKGEFLDYRDRNKLPERDDRGPEPIIPIIAQTPKVEKEEEEEPFQLALAFRKDGGRVPYEDGGGIMDLESQRQIYFIGKLVKKAKKQQAVKKIVKSPVGKIPLGALAFRYLVYYMPGYWSKIRWTISKSRRFMQ